jgi:hypothetical protein
LPRKGNGNINRRNTKKKEGMWEGSEGAGQGPQKENLVGGNERGRRERGRGGPMGEEAGEEKGGRGNRRGGEEKRRGRKGETEKMGGGRTKNPRRERRGDTEQEAEKGKGEGRMGETPHEAKGEGRPKRAAEKGVEPTYI